MTAELFENEPTEAAIKWMEAISDGEFEEEGRTLDELRAHPERSSALKNKRGLKYAQASWRAVSFYAGIVSCQNTMNTSLT